MAETTLLQALAAVRKGLKPVRRNRSGEEFDWADLKAVIGHVRPLLQKHGILEIQVPSCKFEGAAFVVSVTTILASVEAASGYRIEGTVACPSSHDRREIAANVTALRRIGLACLVGLVQEEPEDARFKDGKSEAQRLVEDRRTQSGRYQHHYQHQCHRCGNLCASADGLRNHVCASASGEEPIL